MTISTLGLGADRASIFQQALTEAEGELRAELQAGSDKATAGGNIVTGTLDAVNAAGLGIAKSLYETSDMVTGMFGGGEPNYADKDPLRRAIEADAAEFDRRSPVNAIVGDISQFATGMFGLNKVLAPIKALKTAGTGVKIGAEIAKGAAVGATVFDPQEERLSNFIESYPELHNPVTDYLAANYTDSDAEGRFKAALEGIGLDLAISGVFAASVKVFKLVRGGAPEKVVTAAEKELDDAVAAQREWEANGPQPTGETYEDIADTFFAESGPARGATETGMETPEGRPGGNGAEQSVRPTSESLSAPEAASPPTTILDGEGRAIGGRPAAQPTDGPIQITVRGGATPQDLPATDMATLIEGWRRDSEALATYGSREAAEANGYRFGQAGQLPWQKLTAGEDLRAFTDRMAETFKADLDRMKGGDVLSDARVDAMVGQRAWLYGDDPATLMGMLRQAGTEANSMVANMEAGFLVANKALSDTYRLASQIRMGSLSDFGGDAVAAEKALRTRLRFAVEALGQSKAMSAAAGRSLRRMRGQFRVDPETLAKLETIDIDRLTGLLYESQGNPKKLAQIADPGWLDRAIRGTGSIMANNLLWGWPSHVVNTVTSAYMSGIRPAERIVGSFLTGGGSAMRTRALREYRYMVSAYGDAWEAAKAAFLSGDSRLAPHETEWFKAANASLDGTTKPSAFGFTPVNTVGDLLANGLRALDGALRFPTRALGTVDEFIKQMSYRGYVQAEASIKADELGLKGRDFQQFVQKELDGAFDESYQATNQAALYEAQVRTFSQPLLPRTLGSTLQTAVAIHPSLRAIFPFVRTPINVFRYAIKNMPGLNLLQKEYRDMISGKMGPELQANAYGQMVVGSIALTVAGTLTADGKLTGGGPKEPSLRQALEATGWKPYSFVIENADGSHTYVPYNRFDPIGLVFGTAADITEIGLNNPDQDVADLALGLAMAVAKNVSDKTYLQNVNAFMRAATDPEASGAKWAGQLAEGLIPFSSLLRQTNPDPYMREARTLVDNALDRMPGFSDKLPPLRDPFGYPMKVRSGLVFQDNADDIVDAEQMRMIIETGAGIGLPTGYKRSGMDLRDMHLTVDGKDRTAWDLLQEISIKPKGAKLTMKEALAEEIKSDRYGMAPDGEGSVPGTKLFILRKIVSKYRETAYKQLLRAYPKEIAEPIARRELEAKAAWRRAQAGGGDATSGQINQLRDFAAGYGVKLPAR